MANANHPIFDMIMEAVANERTVNQRVVAAYNVLVNGVSEHVDLDDEDNAELADILETARANAVQMAALIAAPGGSTDTPVANDSPPSGAGNDDVGNDDTANDTANDTPTGADEIV